jgi:exonuclease III
MKIISLNTWGGRAGAEGLLGFFEKHSDTDVFCLQETWNGGHHMATQTAGGRTLQDVMFDMFPRIGGRLPDYAPYFRPHLFEWYGLAAFLKKGLALVREGDVFVHKHRGYIPPGDIAHHARNAQFTTFDTPAGRRTIVNFHGLWNGLGKSDSEERLEQSSRLIAFLKKIDHPFVVIGDFNLVPETESLVKFEAAGLRNLIAEYGITTTRSRLYDKSIPWADYAFVSPSISVRGFRVLPDVVSDHLALQLDFE